MPSLAGEDMTWSPASKQGYLAVLCGHLSGRAALLLLQKWSNSCEKKVGTGVWEREMEKGGMGAGDREQLWEKEGQVLTLAARCKGRVGSPCALLPAKCPNQCQQPTPSLRDNKRRREDVPAAEPRVVSHAWAI